ncbi:D-lactonohydrolase-like protein [Gymnopus androsaceus JB14]|uniref:D-lactonohydrolase-like protein n=1 Tax=Gymnopus androsaceus JB14 TaxID=1447944 RepID=A0A6A4HTT2_9AGAR|nr:D-lactonohydrolase-like protein [Gymnopus androsaceus JB14]
MKMNLFIVISATAATIFRNVAGTQLPSQTVFVDPRSFAVMGPNADFRNDSLTQLFNPTSTMPPFFQVFDERFLTILGESPSIREIASNATFDFAHEAPIYFNETGEVFFSSFSIGPASLFENNVVSKISMKDVETALAANASGPVNVPVTQLNLSDNVQMTNGGTGPYNSSLVFVTFGRGSLPPSIVLVNPLPPYNSTVLLDNFYGRQFNSLDDIKIHPTNGKFFFTDVDYGFIQGFRPAPLMPFQVYQFDPVTRVVQVVADGFSRPNGIAFSPDGNISYVSDTGALGFGINGTLPATIYAFDVDPVSHAFKNRRVLAYVDAGIPDGIQVDSDGNIYSGCADGVQVWSPEGTLLGKFVVESSSPSNLGVAEMIFTSSPNGLVILADTTMYFASIAAKGIPLTGPT